MNAKFFAWLWVLCFALFVGVVPASIAENAAPKKIPVDLSGIMKKPEPLPSASGSGLKLTASCKDRANVEHQQGEPGYDACVQEMAARVGTPGSPAVVPGLKKGQETSNSVGFGFGSSSSKP